MSDSAATLFNEQESVVVQQSVQLAFTQGSHQQPLAQSIFTRNGHRQQQNEGIQQRGCVINCAHLPVPPSSRILAESEINSTAGPASRSSWDPGGGDIIIPEHAGKDMMDTDIRLTGAGTTAEVDIGIDSLAAEVRSFSVRQPARGIQPLDIAHI